MKQRNIRQERSLPAELLAAVPYLHGLPEGVLVALAARTQLRRFAAAGVIFNEGDPSAGLFLIEQGVVKISRFSQKGREHILHLLHRGDTFNDVAALDGGPNPATATAYTDAAVWHVGHADLRDVADQHPALDWAFITSLAGRTRHLVGLVEDLTARSVKGRLARLLLEQAQANAAAEIPALLTQEEMANRLGTVREMVSRALRSLAAQGVIEFDRHRIVILDADQLAQEAEA